MTGEQRDRADDDRLDTGGWWTLAALAVLGALTGVGVGLVVDGPFPWVTVVVLGAAIAVVLPVVQLRRWWARGGRAAVLETRSWVRDGRVPDDVPDTVWRPRLRQFQQDATRSVVGAWGAAVLAVLWFVIAVTGDPTGWVLAGLWAVGAVGGHTTSTGQRRAVRRMLDGSAGPTVTV
jgi:hypothetical protein